MADAQPATTTTTTTTETPATAPPPQQQEVPHAAPATTQPADAAATQPAPAAEAAAPATTAEAPAAKPAADTHAADAEAKLIDDLRKQIEARKAAIAAKRDEKKAKDADNDALQAEADTVRKTVKDRQDHLNALQRDREQLEKEKTEIQPAYERALENKELRDRADALKKEIDSEEAALQAKQSEVKRLEGRLEDVSAAYKREREAKERLERAAAAQLAELRAAVAQKLAFTLPVDDEESNQYLNPDDLIEEAETIFRQRGNEVSNNGRIARELDAIVVMKKEAVANLEKATRAQLTLAREDRDEAIREMVWQLQEERNNLHADIEEIKKVNCEQAVNLRRGHVEKHADPVKFRRAQQLQSHLTPRTDPHTRHSAFRKDAPPTAEMRLMVAKNKELQTELYEVKNKITAAVAERTEVMKQTKTLEARLSRDGKTFETELARIEAEILSTEHKVQLMERENSRMTEAVEHLGGLIKTTKDHIEQVRGKTAPLPLE